MGEEERRVGSAILVFLFIQNKKTYLGKSNKFEIEKKSGIVLSIVDML